MVVSFSVSKPGKTPLVCVAYAPDPNHLFCRPYEPEEPEEPAPAVVPVVVSARDVASLMVDGSGITRQPPGTTARVDMDLIAYTDPSTRSLSTTVAGTPVEVEATPASYHWDWGDATTTTTTSPGAPWPHQTLTHRYHHPQTGVHLTLTTTWTARYRPQDGTWHDVQGTVTTTQQSDTFNLVDTTTHLTDHAEHTQGH
ncbi:zinc transporter [Actinomyces sp. HMT897]|uniref:zinc transporter n=1 Tax=Actinomyces sp. HMT897 TaxID=2789424 RepID=UPI00190A0040|nr:zinc transporter [Actinomyces sp. HMT897]QQO78220.1 zinc transporter [Actinomyces sp. HMT897]